METQEERKPFGYDAIRDYAAQAASKLIQLTKAVETRPNDWQVFELPQEIENLQMELDGHPVLIDPMQTEELTRRYHCKSCCHKCDLADLASPDGGAALTAKEIVRVFNVRTLEPDELPEDCPSYTSEPFEVQDFE